MLTVADLMTTNVVTTDMDASLEDVRRIFAAVPFHHLIVTDDERVVGVISDRDVFRNLSPFLGNLSERRQDLNLLRRRAHQVMSRALHTTTPDAPAGHAGRKMLDHRVSCLPVLDGQGGCVGIVTIRDIARWAVDQIDEQPGRADAA